MKKVLYFLNSNVRGGVEEHVLSILRDMNRDQFDPLLVAPQALLDVMQADLDALGVRTYAVCIQSWWHQTDISEFKRILEEEKPDIVHSHLFKAAMYAAPIAKRAGVPRIIDTAHIREEWRTGLKKAFFIDRWVYRHVDQIIAVSHAIKKYLVEVKRLPEDKITVVHNGVHLENFYSTQPMLGEKLTIGVIGRLEHQKGHVYFLEAVRQLGVLRKNVLFKIIGEGSLEKELKIKAKELGIADYIRFLGFRSDIRDAFDECDIIVLPSLFEGLPLVALEASAMQKALIVTNVDGSPEAVLHEETGLVVEPRDPKGLREAMQRLIEDRDLIKNFGSKAREYVVENFNVQKQVRETEEIYRRRK